MGAVTRWGVVGAGWIARRFVEDLAHCDGAVLAGVASRGGDSARALAGAHGGRAHADVAALLADPDVDAVYVASPNSLHAGHCEAAIRAGKAVLCEKPFAVDAAEAARVVELARREGVFCMEAMWTRFLPPIRDVVREVAAGAVGPVRTVRAELGFPVSYAGAHRFASPELGGGALLDLGVYGVSLAHALLGAPVSVHAGARMEGGVDAHCSALLVYPDAQAVVVASHATELTNTLVIAGEGGRIEVAAPFICGRAAYRTAVVRRPPGDAAADAAAAAGGRVRGLLKATGLWSPARRLGKALRGDGRPAFRNDYPGHGYQFQAEAVGRALAEGRTESPVMPLAETLAVMETLDALRAQALRASV